MREEMAGFEQQQRAAAPRPRARAKVQQPADAPLLSMDTVGAYLSLTAGAVRKMIEGRHDGPDSRLAEVLRENLVTVSPRRRFVRRAPFIEFLTKLTVFIW